MTIDVNSDLFKAILALDSYNRENNQGVDLFLRDANGNLILDANNNPQPTTQVGGAQIATTVVDGNTVNLDSSILVNNGVRLDLTAGFYAIAYKMPDGSIVISYRGTDENFVANPLTNDVTKAWIAGTGNADVPQVDLAFKFFDAVKAAYPDAVITLTGHSLGGGLAGIVGAVEHVQTYAFDSMAYHDAALNVYNYALERFQNPSGYDADYQSALNNPFLPLKYNPQLLIDAYGSSQPQQPDFSFVHTTETAGQALSALQYFSAPNDHSLDLGPGVANALGVIGIGTPDAYDLHNSGTLVIRMFADSGEVSSTSWQNAAKYFWPILYDTDFAKQIGMNAVQGRFNHDSTFTDVHTYDTILRTLIAYSTLDVGAVDTNARPFGDVAIRALYDDANNLGDALATFGGSTSLTHFATDISKAFVQFAGQMALKQVLSENFTDVNLNDGVLALSQSPDHALVINFKDDLWKTGSADLPPMVGRADLVEDLLNFTGNDGKLRAAMGQLWGDDTANVFERVIFATQNSGVTSRDDFASEGKATLFVGGGGNDTINLGNGNNLILSEGGDDTIDAGGGVNIVYAGAGNDTLYLGPNGGYFDGGTGNDIMWISPLRWWPPMTAIRRGMPLRYWIHQAITF